MGNLSFKDPASKQSAIQALQLEHLEKSVHFSMRHCSTKRDECISTVTKQKDVLQALYDRFGHFEKMNWRQARGTDHKKCISIEPKSSSNHKDLSKEFPGFDTYGHLRVNHRTKSKFRIFGAVMDDTFCVLKFDVDGDTNHH